PPLPAWARAPVPAPEATPAPEPLVPAISRVEAPSGPPEVKVVPHQPNALAQALDLLQDGNHAQAIRALEALHQARAQDPDILHWLARAYLAGGEQQRLLSWLPGQVRQWPHDSELRLLLARAQLQAADSKGAVATLERNPPALSQEPNYHALLAASYQQTGQWRESVALYRQLIALRPNQPTWQLGLAIGLEQLDQGAEAGRHYRQALQGQGLDDGSRRFASERSSALGAQR
ncbi:MAG TPA: tetratricopeptide repeat protein, partial [Pseudomonas sp.]|nr:tetratricopeptide repeat protein [Pseudomonas sp.]